MTQQQLHLELKINNRRHPITLDYRRAVYLSELKALLVSDLHWGKSRVFQRHGIPVTENVTLEDLRRLSALLKHYQPERLLVLGDLIHGVTGLTDGLSETIEQWRSENPLPIILVEGNHDRAIQMVAKQWELELSDDFSEGAFFFSHYPQEQPGLFNWCGHIHPKIRLSSRADSLTLPCFQIKPMQGILPAFSLFTGGYNVDFAQGEEIVAIADDTLVQV